MIQLSTELLLQITYYLKANEKRQALNVCKQLYPTFLYALYNDIEIESPQQLLLLFQSSHGYYTKRLSIHKRTLIHDFIMKERIIIPLELFEYLPTLFPNLQVLDFDPVTWKFIQFIPTIHIWKDKLKQLPCFINLGISLPFLQCLGESLTKLSIQSQMLLDVSTRHRLFSIFSLTPNLTELSIIEDNSPATLCLSLNDIEFIHTLLPFLNSFTIIGKKIELDINDDDDNMMIIPAQTINYLHWETNFISINWIRYIIRKYPYLKEIKLLINQNLHQQNDYLLYSQLVKQCRYLEKISLAGVVLNDWFHPMVFQSLGKYVKQIQPLLKKENNLRLDTDLSLICKDKQRLLITALEIDQWRMNGSIETTLNLLSELSQLTYLELKCDSYHKEYNMDLILKSCPILENLILEWGSVKISTKNKRNCHGLKSIRLTYIGFQPELFRYLGNTCKRLKEICLFKCKQLCQKEDLKSQSIVDIDMPNHQLELVMLQGVRLDYASAALYSHGLSNYIGLLAIIKKNSTCWYRHVGYTSIISKSPLILPLDIKDVNTVEHYFHQRQQNTYTQKEAISRLGMELGFIQVRCQSVKHFIIDGDIPS